MDRLVRLPWATMVASSSKRSSHTKTTETLVLDFSTCSLDRLNSLLSKQVCRSTSFLQRLKAHLSSSDKKNTKITGARTQSSVTPLSMQNGSDNDPVMDSGLQQGVE